MTVPLIIQNTWYVINTAFEEKTSKYLGKICEYSDYIAIAGNSR